MLTFLKRWYMNWLHPEAIEAPYTQAEVDRRSRPWRWLKGIGISERLATRLRTKGK